MRTPGVQSPYANLKPIARLYGNLSAPLMDEPDAEDAAANGPDHQPGKADEHREVAAAAFETADVGGFGDPRAEREAGDGADDGAEVMPASAATIELKADGACASGLA